MATAFVLTLLCSVYNNNHSRGDCQECNTVSGKLLTEMGRGVIIEQALEDSTVETSDDALDKTGSFTGEGMGEKVRLMCNAEMDDV